MSLKRKSLGLLLTFVLALFNLSNGAAMASSSFTVFSAYPILGQSTGSNLYDGSSISTDKSVIKLVMTNFVDPQSVNSSNITLKDQNTGVTTGLSSRVETSSVITTFPQLVPGDQYTLTAANLKSTSGDAMDTSYSVTLNAIIPKPFGFQPGANGYFSAGAVHTLWISPYNGLMSFGNNDLGQLGDNTTITRAVPVPVQGMEYGINNVSAGGTHSLALMEDQTVKAWGGNQKGQLGIGSYTNSLVPVTVPGLTGIVSVSAGYDYSLALKNDGTVWFFGNNQFGNTSSLGLNVPTKVQGLSGIIAISAGGTHALALSYDGRVFAWGGGSRGELGNGSNTDSLIPVEVSQLSHVTAIAAGLSHNLALTADQSIYAWGDDSAGQLGDGKTTGYSKVPIKVQGVPGPFKIVAGYSSSFAIGTGNATYGWGNNYFDLINTSSASLIETPTLMGIKAISLSVGLNHAVSDGFYNENSSSDWSWGFNLYGQTGTGLTEHISEPSRVYESTDPAFFRLYGNDRTATAVSISQEGWSYGSKTVVLARDDDFPDALAGTPLAYGVDAPILLTNSQQLSSETSDEISRLDPQTIIILGLQGAVSSDIETGLKAKYNVVRLGGQDRYETAAAIAHYMKIQNLIKSNRVVVAYGGNFPDALAISSLAAHEQTPILLTPTDSLPSSTTQEIQEINPTQSIVVGGVGVVSKTVENALPNPTRYAGSDRYATAIAITKGMGADAGLVYLATGNNFPDALAASVLAAQTNSPIVLVDSALGGDAATYLNSMSHGVKELYVLGGPGVVPDTILQSAYKAIMNQ